jgi:hypothetical protein
LADPIFVVDIGPDGAVATHPVRVVLHKAVAPVPGDRVGTEFNTLRPELVAIACMRLNERPGFEFDSSFLGAGAAPRFTKFAELMKKLKERDPQNKDRFPPLSVFGHADPTGAVAYNKKLSGRRARSVYAVLVRNVAIWDELYRMPHGGDRWTYKAIQSMLSVSLKKDEPPFYTGEIDGAKTKATQDQTRDALKHYQDARGLPHTGFANDGTRAKLFAEYMAFLCHDAEGNAFELDPVEHFIARNKDKKGLKGDVEGCAEFNLIFLPTKEDQDRFDKAETDDEKVERNAAFAETRRVVVYVFRHDTEIDPKKWPCPVAETGEADCVKRFWSDADQRIARKEGEERRFTETRDTMQCRFYHAFAAPSPCEAGIRRWLVRFRIATMNAVPVPIKNRRFVATAGSAVFAPVLRGRTDDNGEVAIPALDDHTTVVVKLDAWDVLFASRPKPQPEPPEAQGKGSDSDAFPDEDKFMTFTLDAGALRLVDADKDTAAKQRLYNLGFGKNLPADWKDDEFKEAVRNYRETRDGKRGVSKGEGLDDPTLQSLRTEHDIETPTLPPPPDQESPEGS